MNVILTVGDDLFGQTRYFTSMCQVDFLNRHAELLITPSGRGYDFKTGRLWACRFDGRHFHDWAWIEPRADLWVVASDGVHVDAQRLGFTRPRDLFDAQTAFHHNVLAKGHVGRMVNTPEADARTLKSWLASPAAQQTRVIPTFLPATAPDMMDLLRLKGPLVAKPVWGGSSLACRLLDDEAAVVDFDRFLQQSTAYEVTDFVFQPVWEGLEKRLCFAGGEVAVGLLFKTKPKPWATCTTTFEPYTEADRCYAENLAVARELVAATGLEVGAVDFLDRHVVEINGAGTCFVRSEAVPGATFDHGPAYGPPDSRKVLSEGRPGLLAYLADVLNACS